MAAPASHGGPQAQYDYSFSREAQLMAAQGYGRTAAQSEGVDRIRPGVLPRHLAAVGRARQRRRHLGRRPGDPRGLERPGAPGRLRLVVRRHPDQSRGDPHRSVRRRDHRCQRNALRHQLRHDQYQRWYVKELGYPWVPENRKIWEDMSPFNRVDKITTPMMIVGGEKDWNVPIINSEQLYQALKHLGREAQWWSIPTSTTASTCRRWSRISTSATSTGSPGGWGARIPE